MSIRGIVEMSGPASAADLVRNPEVLMPFSDPAPAEQKVSGAVPKVDIDTMLVDGVFLDTDVRSAIVGGDGIDRTMEPGKASTVKFDIADPEHDIMRSELFLQGAEIEIDGLFFVVVNNSRNGDIVTITAEDREVNWLRTPTFGIKIWKDELTRGQFFHYLTRINPYGKIRFWCPEESVMLGVDAVAANSLHNKVDLPANRAASTTTATGADHNDNITAKGVKLNSRQLAAFNTIMQEAREQHAPYKVMVDMVTAAIGESSIDPNSVEHIYGTHKGVFQSDLVPQFATKQQAHYFLTGGHSFLAGGAIGYRRNNPHASHGEVAAHVEISDGSFAYYNGFADEAKRNVDKWLGKNQGNHQTQDAQQGSIVLNPGVSDQRISLRALVARTTLATDKSSKLAYQRGANGKPESSWACITRMCAEPGVNWRNYMSNGWLCIVSDHTLMSLATLANINPKTKGVHEINYDVDSGKRAQECTVECEADRWTLPPGSKLLLDENNDIAVFGDWLVQDISSTMFSTDATVTLRRPVVPAPFRPKAISIPGVKRGSARALGGNQIAAKFLAKAVAISKRNLRYTWGGGHNGRFAPSPGYDCSGYISACAHAANILNSPLTSTGFESWGHAGRGKLFTIWANSEHAWAQFHTTPGGIWRADTSPHGDGPDGPHTRHGSRETSGFTPRHWPGC